jgi:2-oxoglutarate ferredoxin oxidoreductase subunit beta
MNPLSIVLGITNISFVAQTASWLPGHMQATLEKAWKHKGLAFVRILQRCPVFMPNAFQGGSPDFLGKFLESPEGIVADKGILKSAPVVAHDPRNLNAAQAIAAAAHKDREPLGLIYYNPEVPTYHEVRYGKVKPVDRKTKAELLERYFDRYTIGAAAAE